MRTFLFSGLLILALAALPFGALSQPEIPVVHYKAVPEWPKPIMGDKGLPVCWST